MFLKQPKFPYTKKNITTSADITKKNIINQIIYLLQILHEK